MPTEKLSFTRGEVDALLTMLAEGHAAPDNLLDNANFLNPVNQRGKSDFPTGAYRYTIDRWRATSSLHVYIDSEGLNLENDSDAGSVSYMQYLQPCKTPAPGEPVTVAAMTGDLNVLSATGTMPASGSKTILKSESFNILLYAPTDTAPARFSISIPQGTGYPFRWAALYRGWFDGEKIPEPRRKSKAEELLECQRYYYRISGNNVVLCWPAFFSSSSGARATLSLPVPMESVPTVSTTVGNLRLYGGSGNYLTPDSISAVGLDQNLVTLSLSVSGATAYTACIMRFSTNTVMEISCEPV